MKLTITTKTLLTVCTVALLNLTLLAQEAAPAGGGGLMGQARFSRWSIGVGIGLTAGYTDINQYQFIKVWKDKNENFIAGNAILGYSISNVFGFRGQLMLGQVRGTLRSWTDTLSRKTYKSVKHAADHNVPQTRLVADITSAKYFKTPFFEITLQGTCNITNLAFSPKTVGKQRKMNIYTTLGHGYNFFNAKSYYLRDPDGLLGPLKQDGLIKTYKAGVSGKTIEAVTMMGVGVKYKLNKKIDLGLETTTHRIWNDKFDGWEKGSAVDYYGYTSLNLYYKIGKSGQEDALEWINPLEVMYNDIQEVKAKIAGLTNDKDGDGVADIMDKDGSTPEGIKVYGDGTSVDQDRDGIADSKDADPNSSIGAKVDENGKEIDSDGDGVADGIDTEPNTASGSLVDVHGRGIDLKASSGGTGGGGGVAVYFPSIWFEMGSANIGSSNYDKLATIARALKANPNVMITSTGHASKEGSDKSNMTLGQKRAQAVADHLMKNYGISKDRMMVESKGKTEPLSDKILSVNRRVDINVK